MTSMRKKNRGYTWLLSLLVSMLTTSQFFCNEVSSESDVTKYKSRIEDSVFEKQLEEDLEVHEVETEDGYILQIHRLRGPDSSIPVYIQHGLILSSLNWLIPGRHKALPYILQDNGYDVWLGNFRGNTFSKKHKTLSESDSEFWNFSWHEQGYYDVPAIVNYITNVTSIESIHYIGYSMGCETFSVMAVERPEIAKKVKSMIALAPSTYIYNTKSFAIKHLGKFQYVFHFFDLNQFLPHLSLSDFLARTLCRWGSICANLFYLSDGADPDQFNNTLLPEIYRNFPAGTSLKLVDHFVQQLEVNEFRKFDYGTEKNVEVYGSEEPPNYDLSKIDVPIALFWGENDEVCPYDDVLHFYEQIPKKLGIFRVDHDYFNHFDFMWAIDAPELLYFKIVKIFQDIDSQGL